MVVAKMTNHFSICGHWALMAEKEGMIGMAFTNTSPRTYPTRGAGPTLGTNPICMIAPAGGDDNFCIDMATTTVALGKVEVERRKGNAIPSGWAVDSKGFKTVIYFSIKFIGQPTTNPDECWNGGGLMPLGGVEQTGGYKGFGPGLNIR